MDKLYRYEVRKKPRGFCEYSAESGETFAESATELRNHLAALHRTGKNRITITRLRWNPINPNGISA